MKFVQPLTKIEIVTLTECIMNHTNHRSRSRAQAILLSNRKYTIKQLSDIFVVQRDTLFNWLTRWDNDGVVALLDAPREGRPPKLSPEGVKFVEQEIEIEPRSPKRVAGRVKAHFGIDISEDTVKRILRGCGKRWKRVGTSLQSKRDAVKFQEAKRSIYSLQQQHKTGTITLTYFDASGFSLKPVIPYAWQNISDNIQLNSGHSVRYNVLGFMDLESNLTPYVFNGKTDTDSVIACFDDFSSTLSNPTWVVLDNASVHTSAKFKANIDKWKNRGLSLFYLPPYSPELNLIEILWRFIKYKWLSLTAYLSQDDLYRELISVLENVGLKYKVTFA